MIDIMEVPFSCNLVFWNLDIISAVIFIIVILIPSFLAYAIIPGINQTYWTIFPTI
jgi:hypothetical protein